MVADNNTLTPEQMTARIAELEGRLAKSGTPSFKVSEKGAVSIYGLGRFPVTLYFEQWNKLRTFLEANKSNLKLSSRRDNIRARIPCLLSRADLAWLTLILIAPCHRYSGKSTRVRASVL